jgi:hypothetical protein
MDHPKAAEQFPQRLSGEGRGESIENDGTLHGNPPSFSRHMDGMDAKRHTTHGGFHAVSTARHTFLSRKQQPASDYRASSQYHGPGLIAFALSLPVAHVTAMSGTDRATHEEPMMEGEATSVTPRSMPKYRDDQLRSVR